MTRALLILVVGLASVYAGLGLVSLDAQVLFGVVVFVFGVSALATFMLAGLLADRPKARR